MSEPLYLNVGCGSVKLSGFVNIDTEKGADIRCDVTKGLPYKDAMVDGIYTEHFIEHLTQNEILGFLRECRRILKPGGRIRIATPDLDNLIEQYVDNNWRQQWLLKYGYDYIVNRAEYLNITMREWGHKWVVNEEEISRLASWAGLEHTQRCALNESSDERLANLETRPESTLIMEYFKEPAFIEDNPLVSIVIPVIRSRYFKECLESAVQQTYKNIEVLVLDDSNDESVKDILNQYANGDVRIRYIKNCITMGEPDNLTQGIRVANGEFIKPLYDDDWLEPDSIEQLLLIWRIYPHARLAVGRRIAIDENGRKLGNSRLGPSLAKYNGLISGKKVINYVLATGNNSIGEPTGMMFRRSDAVKIDEPNVMSLFGRVCFGIGDVCLALHFLSRGDLVYVQKPIARIRIHSNQTQQQNDVRSKSLESLLYIRQQGVRLGFDVPVKSIIINKILIKHYNRFNKILTIKRKITKKICKSYIF